MPGALDIAMEQKAEINMTPMIDCVFLMLLFFMMSSEMSSLDMESMALPYASEAQPPEPENANPDRQVVINIGRDDAKKGIVHVGGLEYDKNKLAEMMRQEALRSGEEKPDPQSGITAYNLRVLVRCDRDARYETVQWVFDACYKNRVYKTIIAATAITE
jgi:biopolymer transport protein ExbD